MSLSDLLTHSINILTKSTTTNEWGEEVVSAWTSSSSVDARVYPISDEMKLTLSGDFQDAEYKVIIPASVSISYSNRIRWDGVDWDILEIKKDSRNHHYEILIKRLS